MAERSGPPASVRILNSKNYECDIDKRISGILLLTPLIKING